MRYRRPHRKARLRVHMLITKRAPRYQAWKKLREGRQGVSMRGARLQQQEYVRAIRCQAPFTKSQESHLVTAVAEAPEVAKKLR